MNLSTLLITIGAVAFILTLAVGVLFKRHHNWFMTFLQNFTGVLFVFSGYVKAIDPLGTAYKMEQYFAEFQGTFEETSLSFLAPLFPQLANFSVVFAIAMIVFEIILGVMLLLGSKPKFTSYAFFILVLFFTFLTGFTYLTGYVPADTNFFAFNDWSSYDPLQMKVTDCGCFGDFLKLEPRISFYKDLALLVPALIFIFRHRQMHQLFTAGIRSTVIAIVLVALVFYSINNAYWNLPHTDFRPFKRGVNIAAQKQLEEQAEASREVISYTLKNRLTGKVVELPFKQYMVEFKSYPKTDWEIISTKMSEVEIEPTKISDFVIYGPTDEDVTEQILTNPNPFFLIIAHKLYQHGRRSVQVEVQDTSLVPADTIVIGSDTTYNFREDITTSTEERVTYDWDEEYLDRFKTVVVPFTQAAEKSGVKSIIVIGGADTGMIDDFKRAAGINFVACTADDILLKTIVRSNPGIVMMEEGTILDKWHYRHLPTFDEIQLNYIK